MVLMSWNLITKDSLFLDLIQVLNLKMDCYQNIYSLPQSIYALLFLVDFSRSRWFHPSKWKKLSKNSFLKTIPIPVNLYFPSQSIFSYSSVGVCLQMWELWEFCFTFLSYTLKLLPHIRIQIDRFLSSHSPLISSPAVPIDLFDDAPFAGVSVVLFVDANCGDSLNSQVFVHYFLTF